MEEKTNQLELLRKYFKKEVQQGRVRSTEELVKLSRRRKYTISRATIARVRESWMPTALRRGYKKPTKWQTVTIPRLGSLQASLQERQGAAEKE